MLRSFLFCFAFLGLSYPALAQDLNELTSDLQLALQENDGDRVLETATKLYALSNERNNHLTAGFAAFAKANVLEIQKEPLNAAKAYKNCSEHYAAIKSDAQAIQCQYKSGLALLTANREGQAIDTLKSAAKKLEKIGQSKSGIAAQIYSTLANETLPSKLEGGRGANIKRLAAAEYADQALTALKATGESQSQSYAATLLTKGLALEDAEKFNDAVAAYDKAIELYKNLPNVSKDTLKNVKSRRSIASFGVEGKRKSLTLNVQGVDGRPITLKIKKRKDVKYPRVNKNQMVDGARVSAEIKLAKDGSVEHLRIIESTPNKDFGEAFEKAVRKWTFTAPEGVAPETIPPFEYNMVFYVKRL